MQAPLFTVFTPTFNRAHTLQRVYDSLCTQTFRDFEWIVGDDGSTDGTGDLVQGWAVEGRIPIRYFRQPNAGKGAATNRGVLEARGPLFLICDSDDAFAPEMLERFGQHWHSIPADERCLFSGVTARCRDERGRPVGDAFPRSPFDSDALELHYRHGIRGEYFGFIRTDVLREFPFPAATGPTRHVPEDVIWRAIARRYKTRFVNDVLRVYHQDGGGQLTRIPAPQWAEFRGYYAQRMREDLDWLRVAPVEFFRLMVNYARLCFLAREGPATQLARLHALGLRLLWLPAVFPALLLVARDRARGSAPGA